jgi:hypothetical protein
LSGIFKLCVEIVNIFIYKKINYNNAQLTRASMSSEANAELASSESDLYLSEDSAEEAAANCEQEQLAPLHEGSDATSSQITHPSYWRCNYDSTTRTWKGQGAVSIYNGDPNQAGDLTIVEVCQKGEWFKFHLVSYQEHQKAKSRQERKVGFSFCESLNGDCEAEDLSSEGSTVEDDTEMQESDILTMHEACEKGDLATVQRMITEKPADLNQTNEFGKTALHLASWYGHKNIVEFLLGQPGLIVKQADQDGKHALHLACELGHMEIVKLLLQHPEIRLDDLDTAGRSPMLTAYNAGNWELANWFADQMELSLEATILRQQENARLITPEAYFEHPLHDKWGYCHVEGFCITENMHSRKGDERFYRDFNVLMRIEDEDFTQIRSLYVTIYIPDAHLKMNVPLYVLDIGNKLHRFFIEPDKDEDKVARYGVAGCDPKQEGLSSDWKELQQPLGKTRRQTLLLQHAAITNGPATAAHAQGGPATAAHAQGAESDTSMQTADNENDSDGAWLPDEQGSDNSDFSSLHASDSFGSESDEDTREVRQAAQLSDNPRKTAYLLLTQGDAQGNASTTEESLATLEARVRKQETRLKRAEEAQARAEQAVLNVKQDLLQAKQALEAAKRGAQSKPSKDKGKDPKYPC